MPRRRRRPSANSITVSDYVTYRPSEILTELDPFYLRQANTVYTYLLKTESDFRGTFSKDLLKRLALCLTFHFEDFVNESGLWETVRRKYEDWYDYPIPFYGLKDYDPEYLNPQDFSYLAWHQLSALSERALSPYGRPILDLGQFCYDHFEPLIEDVRPNPAIRQWLDIKPDIYFFELKEMLKWLSMHSYIFGPERLIQYQALEQHAFELGFAEMTGMTSEQLRYMLRENFLFTVPSTWGALTGPEWLAEVSDCSEEIKSQVRKLKERFDGVYLYEGEDERYYHFRHLALDRLFEIRKESVDLSRDGMRPGSHRAEFGLVQWQCEWWITGHYTAWEVDSRGPDHREEDYGDVSFYAYPDEEREEIMAMHQAMEEAFVDFFGDHLIVRPSPKALAKDLSRQLKEAQARMHRLFGKGQDTDLIEEFETMEFEEADDEPQAAYYRPGQGVMISATMPIILDYLQADELTQAEKNQLFFTFFRDCPPELAYRFLKEGQLDDHLLHPLVPDKDFLLDHFDLFLRLYQADSYYAGKPEVGGGGF